MASLKYVKTSPELFSDPFIWALSSEHKLLWCYICHPPQAELHGIYRYDIDQIAQTLKISKDEVLTGLEALETADRIYTTPTHIWVKRFFRYQGLSADGGRKVIHAVFQLEKELPELIPMWMKFYKIKSWAKQRDIHWEDEPPDQAAAGYETTGVKLPERGANDMKWNLTDAERSALQEAKE